MLEAQVSPFDADVVFAELDPAHLALDAKTFPDAPAVVLAKRGELRLAVPGFGARSTLDVSVRIKILTNAGLAYGQVALGHGGALELVRFEGRTVKADGSAVPLPPEAIFRPTDGAGGGTTVAFPAVGVGAIVDYRFQVAWQGPVYPQTWYFDDRIPTLRNELTYIEPANLTLRHHLRETGRAQYAIDEDGSAGARRVTIRLENAPSVLEEVRGFPFEDLAHAAWIVTETVRDGDGVRDLGSDWRAVVDGYRPGYEAARQFGRQAQRRARALVSNAKAKTVDQRVAAIFRFVRDEIEVVSNGLAVRPDHSVDDVLQKGRGSSAEVALVLQTMLEAVNVSASLLWVADWRDGVPWLAVPRPGWFEKVLVRVQDEGSPVDLDPSDQRLAPGRLSPVNEGVEALLLASGAPRVVRLHKTPAAGSARDATLEMALDDDGRLSGRGHLVLTGHHAWYFLRRRDDGAAVADGWRQWLAERFEGFDVARPTVVESVEASRIEVEWSMLQHVADVLGDEASLQPSVPFGPIKQRYTLEPDDRKTPVRVSFADRDSLTLDLHWPPGWQLEIEPEPRQFGGSAGEVSVRLEVDAASHRLRYRRTLSINDTVFFPGPAYADLRALYAVAERHDAQPIVLFRDE